MPSLRHELLAAVVPRLRGADAGPFDADAERIRLEREHAELEAAGRPLPTRWAPGFERRYEVTTTEQPFPIHTIRRRRTDGAGTGRHAARTTIYYLHGGSYVAGIDPAHVRYATRLADRLDADVVMPDYPLAPEHTWRDSHRALVDDLARRTAGRDRVVVVGDSAGGGLALAVTMSLRDLRGHLPARLVLHAPWVDLTASTPETYELDAIDPWLRIDRLDVLARWWAGDPDDLARPEVSPALGDLGDLPPTLMLCGTRDLLMPGCRLLADRGAAVEWPLTYLEAPGLVHVFGLLPGIPEAARAWRHTVDFLEAAPR